MSHCAASVCIGRRGGRVTSANVEVEDVELAAMGEVCRCVAGCLMLGDVVRKLERDDLAVPVAVISPTY